MMPRIDAQLIEELAEWVQMCPNPEESALVPYLRSIIENEIVTAPAMSGEREVLLQAVRALWSAAPVLGLSASCPWRGIEGLDTSSAEFLTALTITSEGEPPDLRTEILRRSVDWALFPNLRRLSVGGATDEILRDLALGSSPVALTELTLDFELPESQPTNEHLALFAGSSVARGLRALRLVKPLPDSSGVQVLFEGGALSKLETLSVADASPEMAELLARFTPANFRSLSITAAERPSQVLRDLARWPALAERIEQLHVEGAIPDAPELDDSGMDAIADCPGFRNLKVLRLPGSLFALTERSGRAIARSVFRESLVSLDLPANRLCDQGLEYLAAGTFPRLEELDLFCNGLSSLGLDRLCQTNAMPSLKRLRLGDNRIGDAGLRSLRHWECLAHVEDLEIWQSGISDGGIEALVRSDCVGNLRRLEVGRNDIGARGASALAQSSRLRNLRVLDVSSNPIGDAGFRSLVASGSLPVLVALFAEGCELGDQAFSTGSPATGLGRLRDLRVGFNRMTATGLRAIANARWAQSLWILRIRRNFGVKDEGMMTLADERTLPQLGCLDVVECGMTPRVCAILTQSPKLQHLAVLQSDVAEIGHALTRRLPLSGAVFCDYCI